MSMLRRLLADRRGATAIEYSLIGALISVAAIAAFFNLGGEITNTFNLVGNSVSAAS